MTPSAWWMLAATWSVVILFTVRFFWKVLTVPQRRDPGPGTREDLSNGRSRV